MREVSFEDKLRAIKECLMDYSGPVYIQGVINNLEALSLTTIHANMPKEHLIILNNEYPEWLKKVMDNKDKKNVLLIKDFDKISLEDQALFLDIICRNTVSSVTLPENLKIIINSENSCELIPEISDIIQYFEM